MTLQFLPPGPISTGSTAALPAPTGGGFGLFWAYLTQRNCLLLRWANRRVQSKRKHSGAMRHQNTHNEGRGLWSLSLHPASVHLAEGIWTQALESDRCGSNPSSAPCWLCGQIFQLVLLSREKTVSLLRCCQIHFPEVQLQIHLSAVQNRLPTP